MFITLRTRLERYRNCFRDEDGFFEHEILTARYIISFLEKSGLRVDGKKILDVGCGFGGVSFELWKNHAVVTSIDIDSKRVKYAQKRCKGCNFSVCDASRLKFKDGSFDMCIMADIIEHARNPYECIKECHRVLKDRGFIFIIFPPYYP